MATETKSPTSYTSEIQQKFSQALQEYKAGNFEQVEAILNRILLDNSNCIEALKLRAMLSHKNNHLEKAIDDYEKVISILPNEADSYTKIGIIYQQLEKFDRAVAYFRQSLALVPNINTYKRLACSVGKQGKLKEAIELFDQIVELEPEDVITRWNRSLMHLKAGNFKAGLPDYECRQHLSNFSYFLDCPQPMWDGSDLNGRSLLLHHDDDGFGDIIQYIRYASLVAQQGGQVIFACTKPLLRLFSSVNGIAQLVERGAELPDFNVYVPLLSLPYYLGTTLATIPANIPYLHSTESDLPSLPKNAPDSFKIGIVWSSGHRERLGNINLSCYRDCPLSLFISLLSIPEISLYSLQVGQWATELEAYKQDRLYDLTPEIKDFADTAALISQLDLVICVDTAVAHLAGAMGKPVWTLLSFDADWRWLQERIDSPWYPTMRLFRQRQYGDWQSVFAQVVPALQQHLAYVL